MAFEHYAYIGVYVCLALTRDHEPRRLASQGWPEGGPRTQKILMDSEIWGDGGSDRR